MGLRDWLTRLFFEWGSELYARKLSWGPEWKLREEFVAFLPVGAGVWALDVGCGPGYVARQLAAGGNRVVGVDRSYRMVGWAARAARQAGSNGLRFGVAQAESLPFPDRVFDLTVATTVLYLLPDRVAGLREMVRVTRPGGWVATLDPSAKMSAARMRAYAEQARLHRREKRQLLQWAYAAQLYGGFTEDEIARIYRHLGCEDVTLEHRLAGLVLFVRGRVPAKGIEP